MWPAVAFPRLAFFFPPVPTGTRLELPLLHRSTEVGTLGLPPSTQGAGDTLGSLQGPGGPGTHRASLGTRLGEEHNLPTARLKAGELGGGAARVPRALFFPPKW